MASVSEALTQRMNFLVQRQGIVAGNIANANTPGYISKDLIAAPAGSKPAQGFAMALTQASHMNTGNAPAPAGTVKEDTTFIQHNGNSVRLDEEMLKMTDTQLNYRMMTELYSKQVAMQRMALGQR